MILVDANLLVYAHVRDMRHHQKALAWLDRQLNELPRVGLPWDSLLAFVRLVSNPRIFEKPTSLSEAWRQVEAWLSVPSVWIPLPTEKHQEVLGRLLVKEAGSRSSIVMDVHLAALAIEYGLTLCSADGDFARFSEIRWENPVAGAVPQANSDPGPSADQET